MGLVFDKIVVLDINMDCVDYELQFIEIMRRIMHICVSNHPSTLFCVERLE